MTWKPYVRLTGLLLLIVGVSTPAWYPLVAPRLGIVGPSWLLAHRLGLGLDLAGGIQINLDVHTEEALRARTQGATEAVHETLAARGFAGFTVTVVDDATFELTGARGTSPDALLATVRDVTSDFDEHTAAGATGTRFTLKPTVVDALRRDAVTAVRQTIERRVNALGVAEPRIAVQGSNRDRLEIQLPGVDDISRVRALVGSTARLEWTLVDRGPAPDPGELLDSEGEPPPGRQVVPLVAPAERSDYYLVHTEPVISGEDLRTARPTRDALHRPAVAFSLSADGARRFEQATAEHVGRRLAIVLDGVVQSAPIIETRIPGGDGVIEGTFTSQQAADLALLLRSGSLAVSSTFLGGFAVGSTLGAAAMRSGVLALSAGAGLVAAFMMLRYGWAGLNATACLAANLLLQLGILAGLDAALTLPGIAGLLLTVGMGVDASVLIFERIGEEHRSGQTPRRAIRAGFDRVLPTLLDANLSSLLAAAFLFQFGTGPVRGFATTLTIGLLSNLFTAVVLSRTLFAVFGERHR